MIIARDGSERNVPIARLVCDSIYPWPVSLYCNKQRDMATNLTRIPPQSWIVSAPAT
jgi:hypothetical protein